MGAPTGGGSPSTTCPTPAESVGPASKGMMVLFGAAVVYVLLFSGIASRGWKRVAVLAMTAGASALLVAMGYALFAAH